MTKDQHQKIKSVAILITSLALIIGFLPGSSIADPRVSQGLNMEEWVAMRDGIKLHTFIFLPDPAKWGEPPYPTIVTRLPYGIGTPGSPKKGRKSTIKTWPEIVGRGYACVFQNTRGRYFSEGLDRITTDEISDGYDTIEWIAKQSWSNQKVGIAGSSSAGVDAYLAGAENPPHLKAIFSQVATGNVMNDTLFEGQALQWEVTLGWTLGQGLLGLSRSHRSKLGLTQIELAKTYVKSWKARAELMEYRDNPTASQQWMYLPVNRHPATSILQPYWPEFVSHYNRDSHRDRFDTGDKLMVPTFHAATWHDSFFQGQLETFMAAQKRLGNQRLYVLPGSHNDIYKSELWPDDPYFRWFDYWLKGTENGMMDYPPVYVYHRGLNEWRYFDQWPPKGGTDSHYFLLGRGVLSRDTPSPGEARRSYRYDPKNPVRTLGGRNLLLSKGSLDQRPVEPPQRSDVLLYTGDVLKTEVNIAGNVKVMLHASSDRPDTDFTAKLIDVHPDGKTMLVLDGIIRARYRESARVEKLLEPGKPYRFTIDLGDIMHTFKAGHRIQVDISSSNFPKRDRNTNSGNRLYTDTEGDIMIAKNTVFHDADHPSYIVLPVFQSAKSMSGSK